MKTPMEKNPGSFRFQDVLGRFFKTCASWWLNHPFEKCAQVKLDREHKKEFETSQL